MNLIFKNSWLLQRYSYFFEETIAGYVSKSDLANIGLGDTAAEIELLKHTPIEDIAK